MSGVFTSDLPRAEPKPKPLVRPATTGEVWDASRVLARGDRTDAQNIRTARAYEPMLAAINADRARRGLKPMVNPGYWDNDLALRSSTESGNFDLSALFDERVTRARQKQLVFKELASIRARDPAFLKDLPGDATSFDARIIEDEKARRAKARDVLSRSSGIVQGAVGFGGGVFETMHDTANIASLPFGGGGKTIWTQLGRSVLVNGGSELIQQPIVAENRTEVGEELTPGEAALNVTFAAAGGAAIDVGVPQAAKLVGKGIDAAMPLDMKLARQLGKETLAEVPDEEIARAFSAAVPSEIRTPDEVAALHVIGRDVEIRASNPYAPTPAGADLHASRLRASMEALARSGAREAGVAIVPRIVSRETTAAVLAEFKQSIARAESPSDTARNPNSSAEGRYQFTDGTFERYYRRRYGNGLTTTQILAKKTDGAIQDVLMDDLMADNVRALNRAGVPVTKGNMYVMHFAGEGGGIRLLRADPDAPIRAVLGDEVVNANRFLDGKTAGEAVAELYRRVDAPLEGQAMARGVSGDGVAARPAALDVPRVDAPEVDADLPAPELRRDLFQSDDEFRTAQDVFEREAAGLPIERAQADFENAASVSREPPPPEIAAGGLGPVFRDVDPGNWAAVVDRLKAAQSGEVPAALEHPQVGPIDVVWGKEGTGKSDGFGLAKIARYHPEVLADLPRLIPTMEVRSHSANRIKLETPTHEATVRLDWDGKRKSWLITAYEKEKPSPGAVYARAPEKAPASPARDGAGDIAPAASKINEGGMAPAARDDLEAMGQGGFAPIEEPGLTRLGDPESAEARELADSMEHDVRMMAEADPDMLVYLEEGAEPVTLKSILDDLDQEQRSIDTIEACMAPPKGGAA